MNAPDMTALDELLARVNARAAVVTPMIGGASTRKYFRVELEDGGSLVAMFVPDGDKPEEIQKAPAGGARRWPFLEVGELLAERGVDVPRLVAEDTARGWLLIEDLGEDTLANFLLRSPSEKAAFYTRAVLDLARAQASLEALPEGSVVASRAFDADLLAWEIDHFREWGLEARGVALSADDAALFAAIGARLAARIAALPRGFTHRDYQSRNLMVRASGGLVWIDFQDALLGPRVYDLVALLNDSYQEFDRPFVEARLDEFARASKMTDEERSALVFQFDLVTVQRKLKDAGRFVFIDRVKGNPSFLRFVTPTVKKVKASLARLSHDDDLRALADLLARVLPDEA